MEEWQEAAIEDAYHSSASLTVAMLVGVIVIAGVCAALLLLF